MIDQIIKQALLKDIIPKLDKNSAMAVRNNVDAIASKQSLSITSNVDTHVNSVLDVVPKNLVGSNNPLNLVNSNISADSLSSTLDPSVKTLTDSTTTGLLDDIYGAIVNTLGPTQTKGISPQSLYERIGDQLDSISVASLEKSLEEKTASLYASATNAVNSTIDYIGSAFDLTAVEKQFDSKISARAQENAKRFNVSNTDNIDKVGKTSKGFVDPNAQYPSEEYKGLSDTNKLAQGDIRGTVVQQKDAKRLKQVKGPFENSWEQPLSPFKGEYPYNKVVQTESGHIIEIDDTPGSERLHIYHKSGSFIEIDAYGTMVSRNVGSDYQITDKNGYVSIGGKANISVTGTCNVYVGGDANIEVDGDVNLESHNDITAKAAGRFQMSAGEAIDLRAPKIYVEADNELHVTAETKINVQTTTMNVKAEEAFKLYSVGTIDTVADGNHTILAANIDEKSSGYIHSQATSGIDQKAGSYVHIQSGGETSVKAGGNFNVDYAEGHFADGSSVDASGAADATKAVSADYGKAGLPGDRKVVDEKEIPEIQNPTIADKYAIICESPLSQNNYNTNKQNLINDGIVASILLDKTPYAKASDSGSSATVPVAITPATSLKSATSLPENYQLSPNFNLAAVTTKAVLTHQKLEAVSKINLTYGDVAYRLQALTLNVLEPVYNVYPDMIVTSGFRNSTIIDEHSYGLAVDIQFKNASYDDYYDIAKKLRDILLFDEMILEYNVYTSKPYIHISYSLEKNRQKLTTYWNNKVYQEGLHLLA